MRWSNEAPAETQRTQAMTGQAVAAGCAAGGAGRVGSERDSPLAEAQCSFDALARAGVVLGSVPAPGDFAPLLMRSFRRSSIAGDLRSLGEESQSVLSQLVLGARLNEPMEAGTSMPITQDDVQGGGEAAPANLPRGVQATDPQGVRRLCHARRGGGVTAPGGLVLITPGHVAACPRPRRAGRRSPRRSGAEGPAGGPAGTAGSLTSSPRGAADRPRRASGGAGRAPKRLAALLGRPLKSGQS
jgi:hypothetical protein